MTSTGKTSCPTTSIVEEKDFQRMAFDLTGRNRLNRLIRNPFFPAVLQWLTLAVFVMLIVLGWNYHDIRGIDLEDPLSYTNINTLFFWVIWLMGLVALVPLVGRLWCTICPLGYMNDLLARFGLRLRYPRRLKNLYLAGVLLIFYNGLVAILRINRFPDYSARLLVAIAGVLVLVGLIFKGRIFCGYLCPVGAMVGVYSRISPWRLDVRDRDVCRACSTKACYKGEEKWFKLSTPLAGISFPLRRPGCQVDLFPPELVEDPRCVMCTQCIKNCPHDNIRWGTRPFLKGVLSPSIPDQSEAIFMIFLMGATMSIFTRVWPALNGSLAAPAAYAVSLFGLGGSAAGEVIHILWGYALLPAIFVLVTAFLAFFFSRSGVTPLPGPPAGGRSLLVSFGLDKRDKEKAAELEGWAGRRLMTRGIFSAFTLSFIPLILSSHAAFALVKLNEKITYLPGSLRDPSGIKFYLSIHKLGFMAAPRELLPLAVIRWMVIVMVAAGAAASMYASMRLASHFYPEETSYRRWGGGLFFAANGLLGATLLTLIVKWLF